jgi:hypothetical protein
MYALDPQAALNCNDNVSGFVQVDSSALYLALFSVAGHVHP